MLDDTCRPASTCRYIEYQRGAAANAYESATQRRKNWSQFVGRFLGADGVLTLHMMSAGAGDGASSRTVL